MTISTVVQDLERFIIDEGRVNAAEVDPHVDLFESQIVDSLKILSLVVFIEEKYGLTLEADDLTEDNFRTLTAVADLIERKGGTRS
jgi:methoxymalonate biosynthesis acyl carrier protein